MKPGENGAIVRLDTFREYHAVDAGLSEMGVSPTDPLRRNLFFSYYETDYDRGFDPVAGLYAYKRRYDDQRGFDVLPEYADMVREACAATIAAGGLKGAILGVRGIKAAARTVINSI